jgi:hypothetical protein
LIGKIPLDKWICSGKLTLDFGNKMQELTNDYGHECYFGQVNDQGQMHGVGRLCRISGEIYEGSFSED